MTAENPCPICGAPMHPANERRYGHCGGSYCEGWTDALADAPDHSAAMWGCTGTGVDWKPGRLEHVCMTLADRNRPDTLGRWCNAGEALVRGEARSDG